MMLGISNTLSPQFQPLAIKGLHRGNFSNGPVRQAEPPGATSNALKVSNALQRSTFQQVQAEYLSGIKGAMDKKAAALESYKPLRR
ncbi:MAG: hypothetical protein JWR17_5206 [Pseudomonas sp.]|nr:hypothetical protein [Pseudomonas sp.]